MKYEYKTSGVCSSSVSFDINDGIVTNIRFIGGCNGNLKAIGKLLEGKSAEDIENTLKGNTCGYRSTSCADQLSVAVRKARESEKK